ncbi:hypothetical protein PsorP6_007134 [Peronosclerospora sorghi]|uniref:Uncharacterized protein n=1 Tax=Peronosclerospora sorghi TaxID=230839 RepID=A0ACC0W8G7_9STRA|nr:hypothetical protein PsorP6_007134 [Peronosclerospora sorghi]
MVSLDSQILRDLADHSVKLVELCIRYIHMYECVYASVAKACVRYSNCNMVRVSDVETFTNALWGSFRSLDLSSCRGISSFPDSTRLPYLQVLILDNTTINDDGLRAIAHVAPSLKYLPLQDCRVISDDGLAAIASLSDPEGCSNLELVDLMGTKVIDSSIRALETQCPRLRLKDKAKALRACIAHGKWGNPGCKSELLFAEKKRREMVNQKRSTAIPTKNVRTNKIKLTMLYK